MGAGWRRLQIGYNAGARKSLAGAGGARIWAREVAMMFCEIATAEAGAPRRGACPRLKAAERGAPSSGGAVRALPSSAAASTARA